MPMCEYENLKDIHMPETQRKIMDIMCDAWEDCRESNCTDCPDRPKEYMRIMECVALKYSRLLYKAGFRQAEQPENAERCVVCGEIIPEGRQVCPQCEAAEGTETPQEPHIMDSGERREFATGAVRDIQEGKGRCDLLPLDIVEELIGGLVIGNIHEFQETQNPDALYIALKHFAEMQYCLVGGSISQDTADMVLDVSKHFEDGAKKYGEYNWQKGIPVHSYIDSAVRHFLKWCRGDKDEPHDRAFVWNILCLLWTLKHIENAEV